MNDNAKNLFPGFGAMRSRKSARVSCVMYRDLLEWKKIQIPFISWFAVK